VQEWPCNFVDLFAWWASICRNMKGFFLAFEHLKQKKRPHVYQYISWSLVHTVLKINREVVQYLPSSCCLAEIPLSMINHNFATTSLERTHTSVQDLFEPSWYVWCTLQATSSVKTALIPISCFLRTRILVLIWAPTAFDFC
jgi:hypothetical protein